MKNVAVKHLSEELNVAFGTSGVRGLVKNLTPELCFSFVKGFLQEVCPTPNKVAVGIDLRPSSPDIAKACIAAIKSSGSDVIYCGELPTPALAFYAMYNKIPAIMITGSHIPFDRNGIKFYRPDGEINKEDEIKIIDANIVIPPNFIQTLFPQVLPNPNTDAIELFKSRYISIFPKNMLQGKRIGIYEHSSVARDIIKELLIYFGAEVVSLERTSTFVPIDTEAVSSEDKEKGQKWARTYTLDAIVSTDGDGDRPLVSDENGEWLRGDILGVLCANYLNATHVSAPINVNTVLELGKTKYTCLRTKIGSPYVISGMETLLKKAPEACVVGYEANGGFLLGNDILINGKQLHALPTRDSVLPILIILAISFEQTKPISQLLLDLPERYTASDRIKGVSTKSSHQLITDIKENKWKQDELLSAIAEKGETLEILSTDETDGLRMTLSSSDIIHLRASGNAPELRCYVESTSPFKSTLFVEKILSILVCMCKVNIVTLR